ncbi:unnamed protein product [Brassica oleracea]
MILISQFNSTRRFEARFIQLCIFELDHQLSPSLNMMFPDTTFYANLSSPYSNLPVHHSN